MGEGFFLMGSGKPVAWEILGVAGRSSGEADATNATLRTII